ncbi:MAG TPA: DUF4936 family protein [Burkholderiales bacterium]|nr:DUF4936 family protein [Burkholderiales bacterium]
MTNYYVYYRVDAARADALRIEIHELLEKIQEQSGIRGRWMRRRDDPLTFMEVYEGVKDEAAFEALLEHESAKLGLQRKTERFVCA